jgi:hypothetical protein
VFLTGVTMESAKLIESDRERVAQPNLLTIVNEPLRAGCERKITLLRKDPLCSLRVVPLRVLSSTVH